MVSKAIRKKMSEGKPLTPKQKLTVLKQTRALVDERHIGGEWSTMIDGVERFCLYGAVEHLADLPEGEDGDELVSACSLTSTMFKELPDSNEHKRKALRRIRDFEERVGKSIYAWNPESAVYTEEDAAIDSQVQMVMALQNVNDSPQGRRSVLRVLDKAIATLEEEIG